MIRVWILAALLLGGGACGGKLPETRYYQLAAPDGTPRTGDGVIVLDMLATDAAYDDERIVYRTAPVRLDYYQYHRWSSAPGTMIGNYLEQALAHSGQFRAVMREMSPDAAVVLGGRVIAIEEVDRSKTDWVGRLVMSLVATDARSGDVLWTERFEETEPLREQSPEGLAAALSVAMARIAARTAPAIGDLAVRQARAHTVEPAPATATRTPDRIR